MNIPFHRTYWWPELEHSSLFHGAFPIHPILHCEHTLWENLSCKRYKLRKDIGKQCDEVAKSYLEITINGNTSRKLDNPLGHNSLADAFERNNINLGNFRTITFRTLNFWTNIFGQFFFWFWSNFGHWQLKV